MSDTLPALERAANLLTAHNYINSALVTLVVYNHLLTLDDEVSYVWQKKKSWISYLFILNRYIVLSYAIFVESVTQENRHAQCTRNIFVASTLGVTMVIVSDCFVAMRVYAVTGRNGIIGLYLSSLICAKAIVSFYFAFGLDVNTVPLPDIPLAVFKACTASGTRGVQIAMHSIGTTFDVSSFVIIFWFACSNVGIYRFSSLLRTVVTDATVYFIMVICIQTIVLLFLSFADPTMGQFPVIFYGVLIPTLINRFVLSLKKAADTNSTFDRAWDTEHFSNVRFDFTSTTTTSEAGVDQFQMDSLSDTDDHNDIPLEDLIRPKRLRSPARTLGVAFQSVV